MPLLVSSKISGTAIFYYLTNCCRKRTQGNSKSLLNGQQPSFKAKPHAGYDSDSTNAYSAQKPCILGDQQMSDKSSYLRQGVPSRPPPGNPYQGNITSISNAYHPSSSSFHYSYNQNQSQAAVDDKCKLFPGLFISY